MCVNLFNKAAVILLFLNIKRVFAIGQIYTSDANNSYFIEFERKFTWFDSQYACTLMNMTLVEIKTSAKSTELDTLIKKAELSSNIQGDFLWIGAILTRIPSHEFVWLSTGEQFTDTNWYGSNPDFYSENEFCVELVGFENWKWNDDNCNTKGGFVCEYTKIELELNDLRTTLTEETRSHLKVKENLENEIKMQNEEFKQELQKLKDLKYDYQKQVKSLEDLLGAETKQKAKLQEELKTLQNLNDEQELQLQQLKDKQIKLEENLKQEIDKNLLMKNKLEKQQELQHPSSQDQLEKIKEYELKLQETFKEKSELKREKEELQHQLQLQLQSLKAQRDEVKKEFRIDTQLGDKQQIIAHKTNSFRNEIQKLQEKFKQLKDNETDKLEKSKLKMNNKNREESKDENEFKLIAGDRYKFIIYSPYSFYFNNFLQNAV